MEREKVIKGLESCTDIFTKCDVCPYWRHPNIGLPECMKLRKDALSLINELSAKIDCMKVEKKDKQEPIEWKVVKAPGGDNYPYNDLVCTGCGYRVKMVPKGWCFCPHCGRSM